MAKFAKYNRTRKFDIDTTDFEYISLAELYGQDQDKVHVIRGIYINTKSKYGAAPVFAIDGYFVNVPAHLLDTCQEMLQDDETIDLINAGKAGFTIYIYHNDKFKIDCFGVEFVDID